MELRPISSVTKGIEGQVTGVQVTSASGQPGSSPDIRIRGFGSVNASNAPLYVVDGIPYDGALNAINPSDIESMTILKVSRRFARQVLTLTRRSQAELFRLANESLEKTGGEPMLLRRSKLHANILDNITIFIEPEDLLCGSGASKPFGLEMQYEYGVWTKDEVESLKSEIYTITPEDEEELYRLNERFAGNSANSNLVEEMGKSLGQNERLWPFMKSGTILPPWKDKKGGSGGGFAMSGYGLGPGFALVTIDYAKILNEGAKSNGGKRAG